MAANRVIAAICIYCLVLTAFVFAQQWEMHHQRGLLLTVADAVADMLGDKIDGLSQQLSRQPIIYDDIQIVVDTDMQIKL